MNCEATLNVSVALVVRHLRARHGGLILRRLQAVLPLLAALEQVADAQIELRRVVDVVAR